MVTTCGGGAALWQALPALLPDPGHAAAGDITSIQSLALHALEDTDASFLAL